MIQSKSLSYSAREPGSTLRFGRYEVLFRIAAGGMAEVYAARMVGEGGFEKPVALKRMLPTLAEDERFVQMFLDEGRLAAHISSPHVVQTLDLGRAEDESLYLVMELVVGVSLSALIRAVLRKRAQFPVAVAVDILSQAAMGLHDAHEARTMYGQPLQIVHRDVSPQNILVDVSGRVRITDFGVARALERATQTQSGEVKGKLGYFAPEQVKGREIDRRTDVFALGIVAWETLAGRRLFAGDNPAQTLDFVMGMPVPRLDAIRSDVPAALADAVAHALERDLSQRTPSAGDFAEELRYALRPAGTAAVGTIVREHGGESLMKLEEGLRAQSPSSLSRVRRATGGSSAGAVAAPGVPAMPGAPAVPSVPAVPGVPGPVASGPGKDPTATEIALPWPMHDNAATREIVAPPSGVAGARPDGTVSGGYAAGYTAGGHTGGGYVGPAPTTVPLEPTLAPWIAPPPSPPPASSSMTRWVLVGGVAVVGLLGALGVAGWYFAGSHTPAEPRTMALPPLAATETSPSAPPPTTTVTATPPVTTTSVVAPGATTPEARTVDEPPAAGGRGRRVRPTGGATAGASGTASGSTASATAPGGAVSETAGSSRAASEGGGTSRSDTQTESQGTRMTTGTGMSTGLVGVSDFERELGLE